MVESKKKLIFKVLGICGNVLTYLFFALCLFTVVLSIATKKEGDGAAKLFGKQMRIVVSDSMAKCEETDVSDYKIKDIPVKSMVFIDLVPKDEAKAQEWYADLEVGDVLTFRYVYVRQETITHRITEITPKEGGYLIHLEGDNKASDAKTLTQTVDTTQTDSPNYIIGKVTAQSYPLGVLLTAVKSPVGIIFIVIVPCLIIMGFEIYRLVNALTEKKRLAAKQREEERENEVERLRKQLEELQGQSQRAENGENAENTEGDNHS